ncbi:MAG TPA: GH116 family glycosyl hydrolase [Gemmatimonadales bacterium]|nr:GH116 family glycosyl hydrolase [Gemmatimonadales bacterium]
MPRIALFAGGPGADAAWELVQSLAPVPGGDQVTPARAALGELALGLQSCEVCWVHAEDEPPPLSREVLLPWIERGGRLLLTQRATTLVTSLGLETDGPNDTGSRSWRRREEDPEVPELRGLAAFGPHPLFAGLGQGTYLWAPTEGERDIHATYARGRRPRWGAVVACERSYLHLNADRIVAWQYAVGSGGVLCIGAHVVPAAPDRRFRRQLAALLRNALVGDGIPHERYEQGSFVAATWPLPGRCAREDPNLVLPDRVSLDGPLPGLESPLHVASRALSDDAVTIAGRRVLVVGGEQRGVAEIWMHPYRVLQDLSVAVGGETPLIRDAQITPVVMQRHLVSRSRIVEEAVATALDHPIVFLDYRPEKVGRARGLRLATDLLLRWRVDLRRTWPYPAGAGGDLRYRLAADGRTMLVTDASGLPRAAFLTSDEGEWRIRPLHDQPALDVELRVALAAPFRLVVVGGSSRAELDAAIAALGRRGVVGLSAQRSRHEAQVQEQLVRLRSPDEPVNRAFEWAKLRLDSFFVETPGVGRSLVAGYAPTRPGWGDGRPGYAWYFARDACWTAFALLAAGDYASCRLILRFLGASQDVSGKVIHEYSTSGLAHYDAADATPLYLLLAGRYAAWTGDLAFLAERWTELERAYRYCLETDTDGDGLIENTGVGHGWIEMGPLSGAHVSLYLAAIWAAALAALAPVARGLGHATLADELGERAARAREQIATRFAIDGDFALGLLADGTPLRQRTALTAVPLLLGAIDSGHAPRWLDAIASPAFTTPWGVRLISRDDPSYSPAGHQTGTVWPLYTGWVSLAEYACHRGEQGFAHLMANARLPFARGQGSFAEALDGDVGTIAGVCPEQAWSAALLVSPLIEGLLGARPDALANRLTLAPHLPAQWQECEWRGLHVGHTTLDVRVMTAAERVVVRLRRTAGGRLDVTAAPAISPHGSVEVRVDDELLQPRLEVHQGCRHAHVSFELADEHEVEFVTGLQP